MKMLTNLTFLITFLVISNAASAIILPRPENGLLVEVGDAISTDFTVYLTGEKNIDLDVYNWPRTKSGIKGERVEFKIPKKAQLSGTGVPGKPPVFVDVIDVRQESKVIVNTGEIADLSIEALYFDPISNRYVLGNIFGAIAEKNGFYNEILIPDLFADTNGDGALGIDDILYSLVDLNVYMESKHKFLLGDSFSIVNGIAASDFQGMMFSTTPFNFDPDTGFGGTPFDGTAVAGAFHGLQAIPEPKMVFLIVIGLTALGGIRSLHKLRTLAYLKKSHLNYQLG